MYPESLSRLIRLFSRFPTVGPRTATRFAFYCLNSSKEDVDELIETLKDVKKSIRLCNLCFRSISAEKELCSVCENKKRDHSIICVVEKETDLLSIEKTHEYEGIYFILGGSVSPLKENFKKIRIEELRERIVNHKKFNLPKIKEVIIATNQNTEGEATAIYLQRILQELKIKTTRLGRGLPTGGEVEYTDEETLVFALRGRK